MANFLTQRWGRQPQFPCALTEPWLKGLQVCSVPGWFGNFVSWKPYGLAYNSADPRYALSAYAGSYGSGVSVIPSPSTASLYYASDLAAFDGASNYTLLFIGGMPSGGLAGTGFMLGDESGGSFQQIQLILNADKTAANSAGKLALVEYSNGYYACADSDATQVDGQIAVYVGRRLGSDATVWKNGRNVTSTATASASTTTPITDRWGFGSANRRLCDQTVLGVAWNRSLSDAEIAALGENPWQLFAPLPARRYFGITAGAPAGDPLMGQACL
jgi:hypothetical protein